MRAALVAKIAAESVVIGFPPYYDGRYESILQTYILASITGEELDPPPPGYSHISWAMHKRGLSVGVGVRQDEANKD